MTLSKTGVKQALADKEYWEEFSKLTGWRLYGWTYRHGASFFTKSEWGTDELLNLTGPQRDLLVEKLKAATNG